MVNSIKSIFTDEGSGKFRCPRSLKIGGSSFVTRQTWFKCLSLLGWLLVSLVILAPDRSKSIALKIKSGFSTIVSMESNAATRNLNEKSRLSPNGWPIKEVEIEDEAEIP